MHSSQEIAEVIVNKAKEISVSVNKMLAECNLHKSVIDNLKKGQSVAASTLAIIASYLKVSTDYLLGIEEESKPTITIKYALNKASAGTGFSLDGDCWEEMSVPDTPDARRADFALSIVGDSMEPIYFDGDIILVKEQDYIDVGEIGIFTVNDSGYIKKKGQWSLISLNSKYKDIKPNEYDNVKCWGKVIGRI